MSSRRYIHAFPSQLIKANPPLVTKLTNEIQRAIVAFRVLLFAALSASSFSAALNDIPSWCLMKKQLFLLFF